MHFPPLCLLENVREREKERKIKREREREREGEVERERESDVFGKKNDREPERTYGIYGSESL